MEQPCGAALEAVVARVGDPEEGAAGQQLVRADPTAGGVEVSRRDVVEELGGRGMEDCRGHVLHTNARDRHRFCEFRNFRADPRT